MDEDEITPIPLPVGGRELVLESLYRQWISEFTAKWKDPYTARHHLWRGLDTWDTAWARFQTLEKCRNSRFLAILPKDLEDQIQKRRNEIESLRPSISPCAEQYPLWICIDRFKDVNAHHENSNPSWTSALEYWQWCEGALRSVRIGPQFWQSLSQQQQTSLQVLRYWWQGLRQDRPIVKLQRCVPESACHSWGLSLFQREFNGAYWNQSHFQPSLDTLLVHRNQSLVDYFAQMVEALVQERWQNLSDEAKAGKDMPSFEMKKLFSLMQQLDTEELLKSNQKEQSPIDDLPTYLQSEGCSIASATKRTRPSLRNMLRRFVPNCMLRY